ncbi:Protein tyrosine/serine phosphatase [Pseudonocardia thermophila]|uniref:Protein tyrosine/serine phosphatase n=2 Tax=Pseudonocardia thermophila TaxID=1848 RepID=A0A1M6S9Q7_PSETH|nr:tyrosine-protein phosphatase [Pseudonocardia thermophila]SHK41435.1 Protein tyrosine/serine phosphatase [Pseudonocardia thermophila]
MTGTYRGLLGFREVAGLRTGDGRRVRRGRLYRSGTPQFLDEAEARRLVADTGIRSTIDLRLPHEMEQEGRGGFDLIGVPAHQYPIRVGQLVSETSAVAPMRGDDPVLDQYLRYLAVGSDAVAGAVARIAQPGTTPVLVHCTVGKDRTGVVVALALAAVGVERDEIAAEYGLLAEDVSASMERLRGMVSYGDDVDLYPPETFRVEPSTILRFLDAVDRIHGGPRAFLVDNGVIPQTLEALAEVLLEPSTTARRGAAVNITETRTYSADPDAAWRVVGDTGNIAAWIPAIEASRLEGDVRHATFADGGGEAIERIVEHDDAGRTYVYEYLSGPLPLKEYRSRISVREHAEGCEVVWTSDFTSGSAETDEQLRVAISGIYRSALDHLTTVLGEGS